MITREELDEIRQDMLDEYRQDACEEKLMREDFDYFIEKTDATNIIKDIESLIRVADEYGYDRDSIIEYITDNI